MNLGSSRMWVAVQVLLAFANALLHSFLALFRSRSAQAIVELALRQQLAAYAQARPRPRLRPLDRASWIESMTWLYRRAQ